jgi:hypothetical protein
MKDQVKNMKRKNQKVISFAPRVAMILQFRCVAGGSMQAVLPKSIRPKGPRLV